MALTLATSIFALGWKPGWRMWGVAAQEPAWIDLRVITGGVATVAAGGDPYRANPHDPAGRTFNYPSLWLRIFPATLSEAGYAWVALSFAGAAAIALLATSTPLTPRRGIGLAAAAFSPMTLLGVERGNTDLAIFAITVCALRALGARAHCWQLLGAGGLALATVLKLFPALALLSVIACGDRSTRRLALVALAASGAWLAAHASETLLSLANTQIGAVHSYGRNTLPFWLELHGNVYGWAVDRERLQQLGAWAALLAFGWALWRGARLDRGPLSAVILRATYLPWLAGTGVFVATFLAGSSFGYRLWFVLPGLPWWFELATAPSALRSWARVALAGLAAMLFASGAWWIPLTWCSLAAGWVFLIASGVALGATLPLALRAKRGGAV